ncbi:hypothetical protein AB0C34_05750 [Nocardia sp. NPDC049220]|uniref:hypothetical protein n=1 Tax=Nocardia sp. NPDC049220 TaxID=3155273 RepID=UPI0033D87A09
MRVVAANDPAGRGDYPDLSLVGLEQQPNAGQPSSFGSLAYCRPDVGQPRLDVGSDAGKAFEAVDVMGFAPSA